MGVLFATATAEVWIGPSVGLDTPVFIGERSGKTGPGVGVDVNVRIRKQFDLVLGFYVSDLTGGNDADPLLVPAAGVRWRKILGNQQGMFSPFVAAGAGFPFAQAELGVEIAPRSSFGLEAGIRDRFHGDNSLQVFLLLRIGRQHAVE
jgi:hypothetical protein